MRARLALQVSGVRTELREVVLRDKPEAFLHASGSATVPCLVKSDGVIDESLDIMIWALKAHDPDGWLDVTEEAWELIDECDGPFKQALDRTKYATRYADADPEVERARAMVFLNKIEQRLDTWIFQRPSIADFAILPFVRQFAFVDKPRFDQEAGPNLRDWLERFLQSDGFRAIMLKYPQWHPDDVPVHFPSL